MRLLRRSPPAAIANAKRWLCAEQQAGVGLLTKVSDVAKASAFSQDMELTACQQFLADRSQLHQAVLKDAQQDSSAVPEYLSRVHTAARDFVHSGEVAGHTSALSALDTLASTKGQYWCLMGSKSIGKSLLLKEVERRHLKRVFRVDMRQHRDLLAGLLAALKQQYQRKEQTIRSVITAIFQALQMMLKEYSLLQSAEMIRRVGADKNSLQFVLQQFVQQFGPITVIIDEATLPFQHNLHGEETILQARAALELFAALCTQEKLLNVVLVSSDMSFPSYLGGDPLRFDPASFTAICYLGEHSPADTWALLTGRWQMGENLARLLMSCYGGHLHDLYQAVYRLTLLVKASSLEQACCSFRAVHSTAEQEVHACLAEAEHDPVLRKALGEVLVALVQQGYWVRDRSQQQVVDLLARRRVAFPMQRAAQIISFGPLPVDGIGSNHDDLLLPTKQSMRLAIAKALKGSRW